MKNNNKAFFDSYFRRIMYGDMYLITRIISGIVTRMETVSETRVLPSKMMLQEFQTIFLVCIKDMRQELRLRKLIYFYENKNILIK